MVVAEQVLCAVCARRQEACLKLSCCHACRRELNGETPPPTNAQLDNASGAVADGPAGYDPSEGSSFPLE